MLIFDDWKDPATINEDVSGWEEMESGFLREELEEMSDKVDKYKDMAFLANELAGEAKESLRVGQLKWDLDHLDENNALAVKCSTYFNIIQEYQRVVEAYISNCGVNLVTNKLLELRKKGDLNT